MKGVIKDYFADIIDGYVICKICKTQLRNERSSNLKRHLKTLHQINIYSQNNPATTKITKQKIETKPKKEKNNIKLNCVLSSFLGLITEDNIPFTLLNSRNFHTLIEPMCKTLTKRTGKRIQLNTATCKNALHIAAEEVRKHIKTELKHKLVSIKVTSCRDIPQNIYVVSANLYKELGNHSLTLGLTKPMENGINAIDLTEEILATLHKYNIDMKQVVSVTVDDVKNICLTRLTSPFENETVEDIQILPCAARIVHDCYMDVLNNKDTKLYLNICRNLTGLVEKSKLFRSSLELHSLHVPQLDCQTRWGSTYEMVYALKEARKYFDDSTEAQMAGIDTPSIFWDFVDGFVEAMGPLQRSILRCKEEIHYSDFYAQWLKCKLLTECIIKNDDSDETTFKYKIGTTILESMQSREVLNKCLYSCLNLDPRFHKTLNTIQRKEARNFLKHLWNKLCNLSAEDKIIETDATPVVKLEIEDQLLDTYLKGRIKNEPSIDSVTAYTKIDSFKLPFMKSDTDVLKFWEGKKHIDPELYELSKICFSIPPTQTISHSVLMTFKQIAEIHRDCTKDTWENILLTKLYSSYLKDNVLESLSLFENTENDKTFMINDPLSIFDETNASYEIIENSCNSSEKNNEDEAQEKPLHNLRSISSDEIFEEDTQLKLEFYETSDNSISDCESTDDQLWVPCDNEKSHLSESENKNNTSSKIENHNAKARKECGSKFTALHSLKTHMLPHMGDRRHQCPQCPRSFTTSSGLKSHKKLHTSVKPYICDVCNRGFHENHRLNKHYRTHIGEKKFQCEYCALRFVTGENLQRHLRSHTGEKPFRCEYCDKSFAQSNDRNKHLKKHLGDNIFQCELCPLRYPLVRDLRVHFATHKDDDEETRAKNLQAREEEQKSLQIKFGLLE